MTDADPNDPYARLSYRRLISWPARIQREAPFLRDVLSGAGDAVLLSSYRLHQIRSFRGRLDRISITAHGVEVDPGIWELWF